MERKFTKKTIDKVRAIRAYYKRKHPTLNQCYLVEPDVCEGCYELCEIVSPLKTNLLT